MRKTRLTILFLLVAISGFAQKVSFSPLTEKTTLGLQYGSSLSYQTASKWGLGVFYQASIQKNEKGISQENPFYGLIVNIPLGRSEKVNVYAHTRVGIVNNLFFVLTPGLESELKISNHLSISGIMSFRMGNPSAIMQLNFKL